MFAFDPSWYVRNYPDAAELWQRSGLSPEKHYHQIGAKQGRSPGPFFDEQWYRETYADVARAIEAGSYHSGFHHYLLYGAAEGRNPHPRFSEQQYLKENPRAADAVSSGLFRCGYDYLLENLADLEPGLPQRAPALGVSAVHTPHIEHLSLAIAPELSGSPHLNLILPSLESRHMSGGPNTALNLMYRVAELGVPVRLLSSQTGVEGDRHELWRHIYSIVDSRDQVAIELGDAHPGAPAFRIGENDMFVATSWWTAQMIAEVLEHMRTPRFFYLIQDYEPAMSPWSSEYCLGLETYSMDMIPIFNTSLLRDYFISHRIGRFADPDFAGNAMAFEPAVDRRHFHAETRAPGRPNRLLFYARPIKAPRNLFSIGLSALKRCADARIFDHSEWELDFIGDDIASTALSHSVTIHGQPWLSYAGYAQLMRQSDILLSLMLSPHPSYPPLEMAACGGIVVTNSFDCKSSERLSEYSTSILAASPRIHDIAQTIRVAVERIEAGHPRSADCTLPADWSASFGAVAREIESRWRALVSSGTPQMHAQHQ